MVGDTTSEKINYMLWSLPPRLRGDIAVLIDHAITEAKSHQIHCMTADESEIYTGDYDKLMEVLKEHKQYAS
jgi:hypothetical protein